MADIISRIRDIDAGRVMVVTDLHGDWSLYQQYRNHFLHLRDLNQAHTLVVAGDFIHSEEPAEFDRSLDIVLDLIELKASLGTALIVLLGNHELPHIYHIPLSKGAYIYTPRFEAALGEHRQVVIDFFKALPIWVRTKAGVSICHAGAFGGEYHLAAMDQLFNLSHDALLSNAEDQLSEELRVILREQISADMDMPYADVVKHYLAVDSHDDPRYDDYLLGAIASQHPEFDLLWSALFSVNEYEYGQKGYTQHVKTLLSALSQGYYRQNILVTGHIGCRDGYRVLANNRQLRIASGVHAHPQSAAKTLLFDAGTALPNARALIQNLQRLSNAK
jgi:hypothetical protein